MRGGGERLSALAQRQLAAIESFQQARRALEAVEPEVSAPRDARLDLARRLDVVRRQHAALVERTQQALALGLDLADTGRPRALVVHRSTWYAERLSSALVEEGVVVLARLENGADAVGACVADQPDLLLLEDPLPMMTGEQIVREVARWSPQTCVCVQSDDAGLAEQLRRAGAREVLGRQAPPVQVARTVMDALLSRRSASID
ncbi:MAG: hypothetical protein JWO60_1109 [Frankiales bacterium]|nr:hypothetical protein [Frankiales bacterium]